MNFREDAQLLPLAGDEMLAIVARPDDPGDCGVLIVVGGPQYRVGSHRQFLLLSRRLASEGYAVLRFDYRGMGDSSGSPRDFSDVSDDIGVAIDAFQRACPGVKRVVLWGLCDAAAAVLLYVQATGDRRIVGLVLLNPWVRSDTGLAQTQIKHYYGQRLLQKAFWIKLLSGRMQIRKSLRSLIDTAILARGKRSASGLASSFQDRMAQGWRQFGGRVLLILSGDDLVAKEFVGYVASHANWLGLIDAKAVARVDIADADHTFSASVQRTRVENETLTWLARL